ncbi:branched-chain amino acid ABC transporter permease [Natronorubrum sp. JWXQ-INN-674]|uniref:Branched-chain amino acid ABC transporter permease n=1 Tax=Natronorubrum halalkaliphilum TaxID=2691917 RepID=A0A6B0VR58_9EURY|nr:branched-chain amino acid ABC transporter permease [Natronorubrum halalkaliphilum]MXV64301.1 branched-chain amino acid ABC transporter permease [Natronorubrum halalkaliphilum]
MSETDPDGDPETETTDGPDSADDSSAMIRPKWREDLLLIAKIVLATYVGFFVVGILSGAGINSTVGTLQSITFWAALFALGALALNLHWGYTGMFNIGVAGFMAIGAYTMSIAIASPDGSPAGFGLPIPVGIILGMIAAGIAGLVLVIPTLRVRADYFAIVTLGFSEIVRLSVQSRSLRRIGDTEYGTGGGQGIRATPVDSVIPWLFDQPVIGDVGNVFLEIGAAIGIASSVLMRGMYTGVLILFVIAFYILLTRIAYSPFGRVLKAIRDDELAAKSLGKRTDRAKIVAFAVGCALMGLVGTLWMGSRTHISPDSFMPLITFYVFVALIVGGSGSNTGSVIGGFAFAAFIFEGPRFVRTIVRENLGTDFPRTAYGAFAELGGGDPTAMIGYVLYQQADEVRYILLGVVLIVIMIKRPDGLLGHRKEISAGVDLTRRGAVADGGRPAVGGDTDAAAADDRQSNTGDDNDSQMETNDPDTTTAENGGKDHE